jgi:hypothetical protein
LDVVGDGAAGAVSIGVAGAGETPVVAGVSLEPAELVDPAAVSGVRRSHPLANSTANSEPAIATFERFDNVFIVFSFHGITNSSAFID